MPSAREALSIPSAPSKCLLVKTRLFRFVFAKDRLKLLHFMQLFESFILWAGLLKLFFCANKCQVIQIWTHCGSLVVFTSKGILADTEARCNSVFSHVLVDKKRNSPSQNVLAITCLLLLFTYLRLSRFQMTNKYLWCFMIGLTNANPSTNYTTRHILVLWNKIIRLSMKN